MGRAASLASSLPLIWTPLLCSKNNRSFDTPVKGPPQGPRLHIDIPRVQLLIEDKEGIKQIGEPQRPKVGQHCGLATTPASVQAGGTPYSCSCIYLEASG